MKKNITIIILAVAFVTSVSWNWIGKVRANSDPVEDTVAAINTYVGNGGVFSGASGSEGRLQLFFNSPPEQQVSSLTVTIENIDDEDIGFVTFP